MPIPLSERKGVVVSGLKAKRFCQWHRCAICGGEPAYWYLDAICEKALVACRNPEHQGLVRLKSWREIHREGGKVPQEVADALHLRERPGEIITSITQ